MVAWTAWLIPLLATLVLGAAGTYYVRWIRLPGEETQAGIAALAGMSWRDYIHLVLAALNRRGYERVFDPSASTADENEYQLDRGGQSWLLSSKHGTAYVLGSTAIAEFANTIRMRGATGGLLVTSGHFAPEAKPLALAQRIELLDGPTLWPELRALLSTEERDAIAAPAQARARRDVVVAWIGAALLGIALFMVLRAGAPEAESPATAPRPAAVSRATPAGKPPAPAAPPARASVAPDEVPTDPAELEHRRDAAAQAISTLPDVDRALWSTRSTLLVYLLDDSSDPKIRICPLLEQYDELAASRIQLEPPAGSTRGVRFVQCRYF